MPEPQIARRCPTCGASIREVAHFCPQCGNELPPRSEHADTDEAAAPHEGLQKDTSPLDESDIATPADFSDTIAIPRPESAKPAPSMSDTIAIERPPREPEALASSETVAIDRSNKPATGATAARPRGKVSAQIHRATSVARVVEGDVVQRVNKVRKISGVVMDEAAYDPSLRFVLVAVVVFGLFLLIVLLNKLIS
jgi:zinc-ribbon domain